MTDFGEVLISGLNYRSSVRNEPIKQSNYISKPVKGNGLVHHSGGSHTIQIHTINFNGNIAIEATLDKCPDSDNWVTIPLTNTFTGLTETILGYTYTLPVPQNPDYSGRTILKNDIFIAVGQYAWLRANVFNMTDGIVDSVKLA